MIARALPALLFAAVSAAAFGFDPNYDIVVRVEQDGQNIAVDVDCPVEAPPELAWEVLTDYDHMAKFISNLQYSGVEGRTDNPLRVHQSGQASRGPLTIKFDNVREVELIPRREIRSRLIRGDMKESNFVTRIVEVDGQVHIINTGRYTPNVWVPPLIGPALIKGETQKQFGEIRTEILRRTAARVQAAGGN